MNDKRGPKEKYTPEMCDTIISVAKEGGHVDAMLVALDIRSKDTFYRWLGEYPDFKEAYEYSKIVSKAVWENIGYKGCIGQIDKFSASTYAIIMNNKFGDEYKRSGSGGHTEINISNNTLNLSAEEMQSKIQQKLEKLQQSGIDVGFLTNSTRALEIIGDSGTGS